MRKEVSDWFLQAIEDLKTSQVNYKGKRFYACVFFCHQACQKALKAFYLQTKRKIPPKTHNLAELSVELKIPSKFIPLAKRLTPHFITARYPDAVGTIPERLYDKYIAKEFLDFSKQLVRWVEGKLKIKK